METSPSISSSTSSPMPRTVYSQWQSSSICRILVVVVVDDDDVVVVPLYYVPFRFICRLRLSVISINQSRCNDRIEWEATQQKKITLS